MRIAIITGSYPPIKDGVGDWVHHLVGRMRADETIESVLLVTCRQAEVDEDAKLRVVRVRNWHIRELGKAVSSISRFDPDIVHLEYPTLNYGKGVGVNLILFWCKRVSRKIRVLLVLHEYLVYTWKGRMRIWALLMAADAVAFTDPRNRRAVQFWLTRSMVVKDVFVPPQVPLAPKELSTQTGRTSATGTPVIGYWGFVRAGKGLDVLLEAVAAAREELPDAEIRLICDLSEAEPDQKRILTMIRELGLGHAVTVMGYQDSDEVARELGSVDICALPYDDGVSARRGTFATAMALGLPTITTALNAAAVESLGLKNGNNVIVVPAKDAQRLAHAIVELAGDPALRKRLAANARKWAEHLSWQRTYEDIRDMYVRITGPDAQG